MAAKTLCAWCTARYERAIAHELHPEEHTAARLRTDLAMVCGNGYCPTEPNHPKEHAA